MTFFSYGVGSKKCYMDGHIEYVDHCEVDTWSQLWIKSIVEELGYDLSNVGVYWLLPGKSLADRLRIVDCDTDTLSMTVMVPKFQHFALYIEGAFRHNPIKFANQVLVMFSVPNADKNTEKKEES